MLFVVSIYVLKKMFSLCILRLSLESFLYSQCSNYVLCSILSVVRATWSANLWSDSFSPSISFLSLLVGHFLNTL